MLRLICTTLKPNSVDGGDRVVGRFCRHGERARLAFANQRVERFEHRRVAAQGGDVETVDLQEIDIVAAEPPQTAFKRMPQRLWRQIRLLAEMLDTDLCRQHDVAAAAAESRADQFLAVPVAVGRSGVVKGDTEVEGARQRFARIASSVAP